MRLETVMRACEGKWEDGGAVVRGPGGYFYRVAIGVPGDYDLTDDAELFEIELDIAATGDVSSEEPKKRGRKPKAATEILDDLGI